MSIKLRFRTSGEEAEFKNLERQYFEEVRGKYPHILKGQTNQLRVAIMKDIYKNKITSYEKTIMENIEEKVTASLFQTEQAQNMLRIMLNIISTLNKDDPHAMKTIKALINMEPNAAPINFTAIDKDIKEQFKSMLDEKGRHNDKD